jgi:hypothetical protein
LIIDHSLFKVNGKGLRFYSVSAALKSAGEKVNAPNISLFTIDHSLFDVNGQGGRFTNNKLLWNKADEAVNTSKISLLTIHFLKSIMKAGRSLYNLLF